MYIRIPFCAPGSEETNPAKLAAMEAAIIKAYAARAPGVRTGIHTATMAPTRNPLDWDWNVLDFAVGLCKQYGLKILMELAYGGDDTGCTGPDCWDSEDQYKPVPDDFEDLSVFYVAAVDRFKTEHEWSLSNGDVIFTLWNEPDKAPSTTTEGVIREETIDFLNMVAVDLKTEFPEILLAAPSLSAIDPRTYAWAALLPENIENNFGTDLFPCWRLADYLDIHFYNGLDGAVPLGSVNEQRLRTRRAMDGFFEQLAAVPESRTLLEKLCVASEFGKNYASAGMDNEFWEYGGSYQKMRLAIATGLQVLRYPKFIIAAYYLIQNEAGDDDRADDLNYGAYLSNGQATLGLDDLTRVGGGIVDADLMTAGV